ncbi:MAG TPA: cytochrome P450 [Anaerolineae bacterium]|nr:cytochrome P450 [Anaerolineae bacterium]
MTTISHEQAYDLFSPEFKANPHPTFARMRAEAPVYGHVSPQGQRSWYVTRYDDVVGVLKDTEHFVKDQRNSWLPAEREKAERRTSVFRYINQNMLFSDAPDHTRLRALVLQAFTPKRVEDMTGRIEGIAERLIGEMKRGEAIDLIADLALPLPYLVILELLGVPLVDRERVQAWTEVIIAPGNHGVGMRERRRRMKAFVAYLEGLFAQRQVEPGDDLISALVVAEADGERLSAAELSSMVVLLLVTGYETVIHLIGNGALALLVDGEAWRRLRGEVDLWPSAIEEILRFDGPVETSTTRWVREDCEWGGQMMKRGDVMRAVITSANRDETVFERADEFDITRWPNRHLTFGLGSHYCLGAPLARLEGRIALQTLAEMMPTLQLAVSQEALSWRSGVLFRGLKELPLRW